MSHMKDWLYDNRNIEIVVNKQLGHNILRLSVHAHTSLEDINALEKAVKEYLNLNRINSGQLGSQINPKEESKSD
jgi:hypothetical protein